jgi:hypothetical protein
MADSTGKMAAQADKQRQSGPHITNSHHKWWSSTRPAKTEKEPLNMVLMVFTNITAFRCP